MTFQVNAQNYNNVCYIVAGGPSLKGFDWSILPFSKFVIAINRAYEVLPDAQIIYITDADFWDDHREKMLQHEGQIIRGAINPAREEQHPRKEFYKLSGPHGYETTPGSLRHGSNSTFAALNLAAAHLGFKTIYILGLDMKWGTTGVKGTSHFHDGHRRVDPESTYHKMIRAFETIKQPLIDADVSVFNVNPDSALNVFPKISVEELKKLEKL